MAESSSKQRAREQVAIIGPGRVGSALGWRLRRAGYPICAVAARTIEAARKAVAFIGEGEPFRKPSEAARDSQLVLVTTPDDQIAAVVDQIARWGAYRDGQTVVHCSGTHTSRILAPAEEAGAAVASCHPMQTFATATEAIELIEGTTFACEGGSRALEVVARMVEAIGGRPITIPTEGKAAYHIGAVMACNYLVALFDAAYGLYEAIGLDHAEADRILKPLIRGTLSNVSKLGTVEGLTGPIARGDVDVVERHLEWLDANRRDLAAAYRAMGRLTLDIAGRKGSLSGATVRRLKRLLR